MTRRLLLGMFFTLAVSTLLGAAMQSSKSTRLTSAGLDRVLATADVIAEVAISSTQAEWVVTPYGDQIIYTVAAIEPVQMLKNRTGVIFSRYRVKGGTIGEIDLQVSGYSVPRAGDRLLVFVRANEAGYELIGLDEASVDLSTSLSLDGVQITSAVLKASIAGRAQ